jgi:hypothetical protein
MKYVFIFWMLTCTIVSTAAGQVFEWGRQIYGTNSFVNGLAVSENGMLYICGDNTIQINIGGNNLYNSIGGTDGFVAKMDPFGNLAWYTPIGFPGSACTVHDIIRAPDNTFLIAGEATDTLAFGTDTSTVFGDPKSFFVARMDTSGQFQWVFRHTGSKHGCCFQVDHLVRSDTANNCYAYIAWDSTLFFGQDTFRADIQDGNSAIIKLDPAGNPLWAFPVFRSSHYENAMAVDNDGNTYAAFMVYDSVFLGSDTIINTGDPDFTIAKISPNGTLIWTRTFASLGYSVPGNMAVDSYGNLLLTAYYQGWGTIDGAPIATIVGSMGFIAKFSPSGTLLWQRFAHQTSRPGFPNADLPIVAGPNGDFYISGTIGSSTYPSTGVIGQHVFPLCCSNTGPLIGVRYDASGTAKWVTRSQYDSGLSPNIWNIAIDTFGNLYSSGSFHGYMILGQDTLIRTTLGNAGYVAKLNAQFSAVTGVVFDDWNLNASLDSTDVPVENVIIESLPGGDVFSTESNGRYFASLDTGTFTLGIPSPSRYRTVVPISHTANLPAYGMVVNGYDFALQPIPNIQDLEVDVMNCGPVRPGFALSYRIRCRNVGTDTISGSIVLRFDSLFTFNNSNPVQTSFGTDSASWSYANLVPNQYVDIWLSLTLSPTASLNTQVQYYAIAYPLVSDTTPGNNIDTLRVNVTGSFDPNDKSVAPEGVILTQELNPSFPLEYVIRFQNTGTDTAFRVRIVDTLENSLQLPTIELISASHPCTWSMDGNGIVEWLFENILLPDSNTNEAASHGFVKFRIKAATNLQAGDTIRNQASIYFDYNLPVVTNEPFNEVVTFGTPYLIYPANGYQGFPTSNWHLDFFYVPYAEHYQVQIALDSTFSQIVLDSLVPDASPILNPPRDTCEWRYWRVRAIGPRGIVSQWSSVRSYYLQLPYPGVVSLIAPSDQAIVPLNLFALTWTNPANETDFEYQIATDVQFGQIVISGLTGGPNTAPVGGLSYGMQYFWRVRALNCTFTGNWSNTRSFFTNLQVPTLVIPSNGSQNQLLNAVQLDWTDVQGNSTYEVRYSTDPNFVSNTTTLFPITSDTLTGVLSNHTVYYWKVRATNAPRISDWSSVWQFETLDSTLTSQQENDFLKEWIISPNPVESTLRIAGTVPVDGPVAISLLDHLGRLVQEETHTSENGRLDTQLDLRKVAGGLYYLRIISAGTDVRFRIMKLN